MRPKTKIEKQVVAMANAMPPATDAQIEWAFKHLFKPIAKYYKKGEVWCLNCGHIEPCGKESELAVSLGCCDYICPHCGAKLTIENWKDSSVNNDDTLLLSIVTTHKGWQVVRTYEVQRKNRRGSATERKMQEVFQHWLSPRGKEVIASRAYSRSFYYHKWYYDSPFEIKKHNARANGYYYYSDVFNISGNYFYPRINVIPILKRNGFEKRILNLYRTDVVQAMRYLLICNEAEMLAKTRQWSLLSRMVNRGESKLKYPHAVNICNRNGYIVDDADCWTDYLDLLNHFNLDTHNANYVCPKDLHSEHNKLVRRKRRIDEQKRLEEKRKESVKFEKQYAKRYGKFLGVVITNGEITCHVLQSVAEFAEEGIAMHHCVYANGYFDYKRHPNTLILSARGKSGERIETIEVNLKTLKIVQARGRMNQTTDKHQEIIDLINNNMHLIKKAI